MKYLVQVKITANKIIFAIYVPIFPQDISQIYHLIPIPHKNSIVIPDYLYLIFGVKSHQFENTVCPQLDNTYFCQKQDDPTEDQCIIPLIRVENPNWHSTKTTLTSTIIQEINKQHLVEFSKTPH